MLAEFVHRHHSTYDEDLPFWHRLAAQAEGLILELGCGSGRVLLSLAEAGHHVVGLDVDRAALDILKRRVNEAAAPLAGVFQADLTRFRLAQAFGLILFPCNTYSTLSPEQRRAALDCVCQHLAPGGLFAVSFPNPELLKSLPLEGEVGFEGSFHHPEGGNPVQVSSAWRRRPDGVRVSWHYDHLLPDGRVERHTVETRHFLSTAEELLAEFQAAGLQPERLHGDFDESVHSPESPYLIVVARAVNKTPIFR